MKSNTPLLLLVATATAALAAALGQGSAAVAVATNPGSDAIIPRSVSSRTITVLTTIPWMSLKLPPTSVAPVVQTAYVYETVWSNPVYSTWTTLATGTILAVTPSTSTQYTTMWIVANHVTMTTTTIHPHTRGMAADNSTPDAVEIPPHSSVITAVGSPLSTSASSTAESLPLPMLSAPVSSTITTLFPLHTEPTAPSPSLTPVSNTSASASVPEATLTLSEVPLPTAEPPATTLMTSVVPDPAPTPAPSPGNFSCVENWCSDNGASYCLYWGGITAENSAGEPLPGMVLTQIGGCTLVTAAQSGGSATAMTVSAPDTAAPSTAPAALPPAPAGPGATPAPLSEPSLSLDWITSAAPSMIRPRGRGRV